MRKDYVAKKGRDMATAISCRLSMWGCLPISLARFARRLSIIITAGMVLSFGLPETARSYTTCSPGAQSGTEACGPNQTINQGVAYSPIGAFLLNVLRGTSINARPGERGVLIPGPVTPPPTSPNFCSAGSLQNGQCVATSTPQCPLNATLQNGQCVSTSTSPPFCPTGATLQNGQCVQTTTSPPILGSGPLALRFAHRVRHLKEVASSATMEGVVVPPAGCQPGFVVVGLVCRQATCSVGTLQGNQCVATTTTAPQCSSGTLQGGQCVTQSSTPASCTTGSVQGNVCVATSAPTCSSGILQNGQCVQSPVTGPPPNTPVSVVVAEGARINSPDSNGIEVQTEGSGTITIDNAGAITAGGVGILAGSLGGQITITNQASGQITAPIGIAAGSEMGAVSVSNFGGITFGKYGIAAGASLVR